MTLTTFDKVARLVQFATGEEYGDGMLVTDVISGYAEPGYGRYPDSVVVLGNWNDKTWFDPDTRQFHTVNDLPSRLMRSLERVGAEIEWLDEWTSCQGCYKAVRTQSDSYMWKPFYAYWEGELLCANCLIAAGEDALEDYLNNSNNCVTWCEPSHVESFGFVKWEPGDEHTYENGWHPGQTDNPSDILAAIQEVHPASQVVFFLDESSQFYIRFSAYVKGI